MLVENKFLFVNLPRCASTSFHISCLRSGFKIEHYAQSVVDEYHTPINLTPGLLDAEEPDANIAKGATCSYPPTPATLTIVAVPASLR